MLALREVVIGEKYRLVEPIGHGGMATVWRAVHETLGRPVAVKLLEAAGPHAQKRVDRFLREARLLASFRHRHVVDVLDFGTTPEGQPYMVMELLEGYNLSDRLRGVPALTDLDLLEIMGMVLSGLGAVHDAGIIHRDLKPENVFLTQDADGYFAKILDFGISKGFEASMEGGQITHSGAVVGTPHYMSPEQARGVRDIDARSDLFSAGVILYLGLAGRLPFDAENPGDILIMLASQDPTPLELLRPDLPEPITDLVDRALARNRDARFQDAREMREALQHAAGSLGTAGARRIPPMDERHATRDYVSGRRPRSRGDSTEIMPSNPSLTGLAPTRRAWAKALGIGFALSLVVVLSIVGLAAPHRVRQWLGIASEPTVVPLDPSGETRHPSAPPNPATASADDRSPAEAAAEQVAESPTAPAVETPVDEAQDTAPDDPSEESVTAEATGEAGTETASAETVELTRAERLRQRRRILRLRQRAAARRAAQSEASETASMASDSTDPNGFIRDLDY